MEEINNSFKQKGYVKVSNVLSKDICKLVSDYVCLKAKVNPNIRRGSDTLADIHREYADPLIETFLTSLHSIVEKATGMELFPTLSFCYHYKTGNKLVKHKDRDSCEVVAGIFFGSDPEPDLIFPSGIKNKNCPLIFNIDNKPESVDLNVGDMVIFKGSEIEHWREPFEGKWLVSAILGYVDKNGKNSYQKYDQRKSIGTKHIGMFRWTFGKLKAKFKQLFN